MTAIQTLNSVTLREAHTSLMDFALLLLLSAWIVVLLPQLRRNVWAILVVGTQQLLALNGVSINQRSRHLGATSIMVCTGPVSTFVIRGKRKCTEWENVRGASAVTKAIPQNESRMRIPTIEQLSASSEKLKLEISMLKRKGYIL